MSQISTYWRVDRPESGFYTSELPAPRGGLHLRTFLPDGYEPGYAYPLLVFFHPHGSNEEHVLRLVPRVSRRNFIAISFRGPEQVGERSNGSPACGWGDPESIETVTESVLRAVEQTRRMYHVHSERVYLVGVGDGADGAYRAAFELADDIAGVVSLNGALPASRREPAFRCTQGPQPPRHDRPRHRQHPHLARLRPTRSTLVLCRRRRRQHGQLSDHAPHQPADARRPEPLGDWPRQCGT